MRFIVGGQQQEPLRVKPYIRTTYMYRERERTSRDVDTACVQVQRAAIPFRVDLRVPDRYCSSGADPGCLCLPSNKNVDPNEMLRHFIWVFTVSYSTCLGVSRIQRVIKVVGVLVK